MIAGDLTYKLLRFHVFRRYEFRGTNLVYTHAIEKCKQENGRLAEPHNLEQFLAIFSLRYNHHDIFWLGGDRLSTNEIVFLSDKSPVTQFWNPHEPNNQGGNEKCLEFRVHGLNDRPCHAAQPYVCEFGGEGPNVPVCSY